MKTPKKIYLATTEGVQNLDTSFVGIAHSDPQDIVEPVEYVRKDAFIDKADTFISSFFHPDDTELKKSILDEFHKYMDMEGE